MITRSRPKARAQSVVAMLLVFCFACSDSTGPETLVEGTWLYSASIEFSDRQCVVQDVALQLNQSGSSFSGTVEEGTSTCTPGSTQPTSFHDVNSVVINDGTVSFNLGGDDSQHTGSISNGEIEGTVEVFTDDESGVGSFRMDRP